MALEFSVGIFFDGCHVRRYSRAQFSFTSYIGAFPIFIWTRWTFTFIINIAGSENTNSCQYCIHVYVKRPSNPPSRSTSNSIIRRCDAVSYRLTIIRSLHNLWTKAIFLFADSGRTLVICELRANHYSQSKKSVTKGNILIRRSRLLNRKSANYGEPFFAA